MVPGNPELARQVFKWGYKDLKNKELKAEVRLDVPTQLHYTDTDHSQCAALLEAWKAFKQANGTETDESIHLYWRIQCCSHHVAVGHLCQLSGTCVSSITVSALSACLSVGLSA